MHDVCSDVEGEGEGIWFHFGEVCVVWFVGSKVGWYLGREVEGERGRVEDGVKLDSGVCICRPSVDIAGGR